MIPQNIFSFFNDNIFAIAGSTIYFKSNFKTNNSEDGIYVNNAKICLPIKEKIAYPGKILTNGLLKEENKLNNETLSLYSLLYETATGTKLNGITQMPNILELISQPCLNIHGKIKKLEINQAAKDYVLLNNKKYAINPLKTIPLEEKIQFALSKSIKDIPKEFFSEKNGIGYKTIDNAPFIYKKVPQYVLFEIRNGCHYRMPECRIGFFPYLKNNEAQISEIIVMNQYAHPALKDAGKEMQKLCTGDDDYLKRLPGEHKGKPVELLKAALTAGIKSLTRGYTPNARTYSFLTDPIFNKYQTEFFRRNEVANR